MSSPRTLNVLKLADTQFLGLCQCQRIDQRQAEFGRADLEHIARLGFHTGCERERPRAVAMHVHIARPAELAVFEMMPLEIVDRVGHVGFAGEKWLLEDDLLAAPDPRRPANILRQRAKQDLRPEGTWPELRM